jgi:diguanylate cyclase (GGDEF)-like protein
MNITTMVFALALGNLTLCAALFFYEYGNSKSLTLSTWAISKQLQGAAWLLLCLAGTGIVPDIVSIPIGTAVLFAGVAMEAGALWEAADRPRWRRIGYPAVVLAIFLFLACYFIDETALRQASGSLILGVLYLVCAAGLASRWHGGSMLRRFLAIAVMLLALAVIARGAVVLSTPAGWGWISPAMLLALSSAAYYLLMLLLGFGYLLLMREQAEAELARQAVVDVLTDVPNRRGFYNSLAPWMALARRPGLPTALVMIDFDQFKRVNDSYGHPAGDAVLRALVDVCKRQLRDSDQMGRMVGVEFALLLPRTSLPEAVLVAERIRAAIEAFPVKTERAMINLTASFGVTTIRADDSTVSLFKRADEALQEAKLAGRNKVIEAAVPSMMEA